MSAPGGAVPCCLLVDGTPVEQAALAGLPGLLAVAAEQLEEVAAARAGCLDAVVVGSACRSAVAVVQRAHRAAPYAGAVVLTRADTAGAVRRALSYAPGVPIDVLVLDEDAPLEQELGELREAVAQQRRHRELVATVSARAVPAPAPRDPLRTDLGTLLEHAPLGVLVCEPGGRLVGWNRRAATLLGLSLTAESAELAALLPGADDVVADAAERLELDPESPPSLLTAAGGAEVQVSGVPSQLSDGSRVVLLLVVDVTGRRAAERARDQLAAQVAVLSEVSESLTSTLDIVEGLDLLAQALVPRLADWVSIHLADESGQLSVVTMRHRDPALVDVVEQARALQAVAASDQAPSRRTARTAEPVLLTHLDDETIAQIVPDAALRGLVVQLGLRSVITVPLPGRHGTLGSLALINGPQSRAFSAADVTVALEVGRRAGVALDNARLYGQQRELATELQRSLLTAPPQPDHGQIAVRYVAAAQEAQVGGDWYDAFLQPDGATVLVIGDVVGHDTRAAAGMSQLRGILRGVAFTTGADPAEVLSRVDAAIEGLLLATTATAVVARLEQEPEDVPLGRTWLTWSNAGHPPPLVLDGDGSVTVLENDSGEADLLLGIDPGAHRTTRRTALRDGSTVLLYTDGLVERRGQSLDEGVAALAQALRDGAGLPLDELCDTTLHRLLPDRPEDDVALVAVRLRPQDRPRPDEAGPHRVPPGVPDPPLPT